MRNLPALAILALLAASASCGADRAPSDTTQVPSIASDGGQLREEFNADRDQVRLLMLLSPS